MSSDQWCSLRDCQWLHSARQSADYESSWVKAEPLWGGGLLELVKIVLLDSSQHQWDSSLTRNNWHTEYLLEQCYLVCWCLIAIFVASIFKQSIFPLFPSLQFHQPFIILVESESGMINTASRPSSSDWLTKKEMLLYYSIRWQQQYDWTLLISPEPSQKIDFFCTTFSSVLNPELATKVMSRRSFEVHFRGRRKILWYCQFEGHLITSRLSSWCIALCTSLLSKLRELT